MDCAKQSEKHAVTETKIYPGLGHFELEGPHYDAEMADLAADFAARHRLWDGDVASSPPLPAPAG